MPPALAGAVLRGGAGREWIHHHSSVTELAPISGILQTMLSVFFTVDTEAHPASPHWAERGLADEIRRDIDGVTPKGEFGAFYQADILKSHGLQGVFFVEALR